VQRSSQFTQKSVFFSSVQVRVWTLQSSSPMSRVEGVSTWLVLWLMFCRDHTRRFLRDFNIMIQVHCVFAIESKCIHRTTVKYTKLKRVSIKLTKLTREGDSDSYLLFPLQAWPSMHVWKWFSYSYSCSTVLVVVVSSSTRHSSTRHRFLR